MGGRLYWRGGIFQRRRNLFKIGGGRLCKIINGGGGGGGGGGGCSPLRRRGGGGGGGSPLLAHRKYVLLTVTVLQSARNEVDVIW